MSIPGLNKKIADLTVLELQDLLNSLDDDEYTDSCPPEDIDVANTVGQLTVGRFITVLKHSVPQGLPKP
jgi:hypothetical protein